MTRRAFVLASIATLMLAALPGPARASQLTAADVARGYREGYVLAKPRKDHLATVDAAETAEGMVAERKFTRMGNLRKLRLRAGDTAAAALRRLAATGRYEFVETDRILHANAMPDDPDFSQQWALYNTGGNGPGGGIAGADIHALAAWNTRTSASSVIVAVIDSGVLTTHSDIVANLWINPLENLDGAENGYTGDKYGINTVSSNGIPTDDSADGHGTHVSGILGAVGNNDDDISGVAWQVQIMALKFLNSGGSGTTSDEIECIDFAISHGANLINASFGSSTFSQSEFTAIQEAGSAGIIFVAAAGNLSEDNDLTLNFPASYLLDNVVSVGCSDNRDDVAFFSAYGSGVVDLFAPGYDILSLSNASNTATEILSGTSMSTPMVTGSLALLKAQFPGDSYRQLINRVLSHVDPGPDFAFKAQSGGRLNLAAALGSAPMDNAPMNDTFARGCHLAGTQVTARADNSGASIELGEPSIAGTTGGHSLWWDWKAPVTGSVAVTTSAVSGGYSVNSSYPTLVGVYTGSALSSLSAVAVSAAAGNGASNVTFTAQAGTTYEITVDGQNGATGFTLLHINYLNDAFETPVTLTGSSVGITATNVNASREAGEPLIQNNPGGHSVWYQWTAPASRQYSITALSPDFDTLLGVYTGSSLTSLTTVTSSKGASLSSSASVPVSVCSCTFSAAGGTTYFIAIDGGGDADTQLSTGQFTLSIADDSWQYTTGDGITCSPAVGPDGTVYVGGDDGYVYALTPGATSGTLKWRYRTGGALDSTAASVSGDGTSVYAVSADGYVYALATASGALEWRYGVASSPPACAPTLASDGTIYVRDSLNTLYALNPAGTVKWTCPISGISYASPTVAADGTVYIGSDNGFFYAVNPASGAIKWSFNAGGAIYTAAAIDGAGNAYFATLAGTVYAVNPLGVQIWSYLAGNSVTSSPALGAGGTVYFGCYDHNLYALGAATGALQWTCALGAEVRASSPAVDANGVIYVGCYDNNVYAVNPNGTVNRIFATGYLVRSSPVISGGALYVGSEDHNLYAFNLGVGPAASAWPMHLANAARNGEAPAVAPTVLTQPISQSVPQGTAATLTVAAYGSPTLSYQWYKAGVAITGATAASYSIASPQAGDAGSYTVRVGNSLGNVLSNPAILAVTVPAPVFTLQPSPAAVSVASGRTVVFNATATGSAATTYQWTLNGGTAIPGASVTTDPILMVTGASSADAGSYVCTATNPGGSTASASAVLTVVSTSNPGYLTNVSARGYVGTGSGILIGGFGVVGTGSKQVLIRGIGPGLNTQFQLTGYVADPQVVLFSGPNGVTSNGQPVQNDDWATPEYGAGATQSAMAAAFTALGAYSIPPSSLDAALLFSVPVTGGGYTAQVSGANGGTGTGVIEIYDADSGAPATRLANLSARDLVQTGQNILIGGFYIGGSTAETVLIRGIGPGLNTEFGLAGWLVQPVLALYSGGTPIYSNTIWGGDPVLAAAEATVGAYSIPSSSLDALLLVTLPPGGYTAQITGLNGTTGLAVVEIYELP